jgi:hypothetical protein
LIDDFGELMNHTRRHAAGPETLFEIQPTPTTPIRDPFYPIALFIPF